MGKNELTFDHLVDSIRQVHKQLVSQAGRAVNISLTLRNWVIGCYIREYEQNGADRARYGDRLLEVLSERLTETGMKGIAPRSLRLYRQFYLTYPQIWQTVSAKSLSSLFPEAIWQSLSAKSGIGTITEIEGTVSPEFLEDVSESCEVEAMKLPAASCGVSKRNCAVALTRLRSIELRRGSPCLSSLLQAAGYSGEGE
jgi:hypothetical protein